MTEYIDREKLIATINKNPAEAHNERCAQLLEALLQAPTEDVVPRSEVEELIVNIADLIWQDEDEKLNIPMGGRYFSKQEFIVELKKKHKGDKL